MDILFLAFFALKLMPQLPKNPKLYIDKFGRLRFKTMKHFSFVISAMMLSAVATFGNTPERLPDLDTIPAIPPTLAPGSVALAPSDTFEEVAMDLPVTPGPFEPTWASIEANHPGTPQWLCDAKFGIWVHFGPQSMGQSGDWYARNLYKPSHHAYKNHVSRFGHPSEFGYKDILKDWNPSGLDPERLTALYKKAGARFLMIQGVHHDNYDLWNSRYQPWNSVNVGPKRDLLREWADACRKNGMRYGVTFHHEYTWWWWQTAFGADSVGEYAGVPYDGHLTLKDGKGKWWEGLDPRQLYGINLREYESVVDAADNPWRPPKDGIFTRHLDYCYWFAKQWALRMMDVVENYDPDFIYTDGTKEGPFTGTGTATGYKCNAMQTVMADYYNRTLKKRGIVDTFSIIKFRHPTNGAVNTAEFSFPDKITTEQPWIREAPVGDWFYAPGFTYDSDMMIRFIIEACCRDGNAALNICLRPDGSIDDECVRMLEEVGAWLETNGEAIYGSRAWTELGEGEMIDGKLKKLPGGGLNKRHADFKFSTKDFRYTVGKNNALYAMCMTVPQRGEEIIMTLLGKGASNLDKPIKKVTLLGYDGNLKWSQTGGGLKITYPKDFDTAASAVTFRID